MATHDRVASRIWELPELPGYVTVTQAAKMFGVTKENIFYKIYTKNLFRNVYRIGSPEETQRPAVLILRSEVEQVIAEAQARTQARKSAPPSYAAQLNAWNKRVKDWGLTTGWKGGEIHVSGRPVTPLVQAYLTANPEDPKPTE